MHEGLREFEGRLKQEKKPRDLRHLVCAISVQRIEEQPFHEDILMKTRDRLRVALQAGGFGDGLPQEGDVDQPFEVRLIQGLLAACSDPNHYFGGWWARGVAGLTLPEATAVARRV